MTKPNPIDVHVGSRVRIRRTLLGISQTVLGEAIGLTFQQIQKYERGTNRIGASKLYGIANALDVNVGWFFEDMPGSQAARGKRATDDMHLVKRETLELVRSYYKVSRPQRKRLFNLVKSMVADNRAE